jgi:hypothetical protein
MSSAWQGFGIAPRHPLSRLALVRWVALAFGVVIAIVYGMACRGASPTSRRSYVYTVRITALQHIVSHQPPPPRCARGCGLDRVVTN